MTRALALTGLVVAFMGALVLAWQDLSGKRRTWATLAAEPSQRKRAAWLGFPLIALGTAVQAVAIALD